MTLLTFAQYIIMKREALKLTTQEAATRMSITSNTLYTWEKGINFPSRTSLEKLKTLYRMSDDELDVYLKDKTVVDNKAKERPIGLLIERATKSLDLIEECINGTSNFERGIKDKAVAIITETIVSLKRIVIIDEAF